MPNNNPTKYPDLPSIDWTIVQVGRGPFHEDLFYGLNTKTGERTNDYPTYGLALKEVERREWYPQ